MHRIAEGFSDLLSDILAEAYDVAWCSHPHNLSIIGHAVKGSVNSQSSFAEERFDVERHLHVSCVHFLIPQYDCVEF